MNVDEYTKRIANEKAAMEIDIRNAVYEAMVEFKRATGLSVTAINIGFLELRENGQPREEYILESVTTKINLGI